MSFPVPEVNEASASYSRKNVVGEAIKNDSKQSQPITNDYKQITDLAVYLKAVRRVSGYLGFSVGDREFRALSMVYEWCKQFKREGGPRSKIVDWSGYTPAWRYRMQSGIGNCLDLGLLENREVRNGHILVITEKGYSVFRALEIQSQIVKDEFAGLREKPSRRAVA